jgi:small-conductance mechanosensitive channel
MKALRRGPAEWRFVWTSAILAGLLGRPALGQVPGLPSAPATSKGSPATTKDSSATKGSAQPAAEKAKSAVATSAGPINIHPQVSDREIQRFLTKFLPKYPGVEKIAVSVDEGVVTLTGRVDDEDTQDELTDFLKRVQGVILVLNQTETDDQVMTGWQFARQEAGNFFGYLARKWVLILLSLAIVAISWLLAQAFATHSETLLAPVVHNVLLRSVVGSVISGLIVIGGLILALQALRLTQAVMSIVGVSGLVVLAVGFAFRDITENFIASVLLGLRRPFQVGDYVTIAGQSGVVKSLNTRATVLVTLDGKHVRIPNSTIFKEIMVNATASPSFRTNFDVVIPTEASTAAAIDAINRALRETPGILSDPPPRALVEALESGGVRLRADFWTPTHNIDWFQLMSDAKLRAKVALQQAGVIVASPPALSAAPAPAPALPAQAEDQPNGRSATKSNGATSPPPDAAAAGHQAAANLARDVRAARDAPTAVVDHDETPMARALQEPETRVSDEGTNLLKGPRAE